MLQPSLPTWLDFTATEWRQVGRGKRGAALQFFEYVREQVTDALVVVDMDGKIAYAGTAVQSLLGYTNEKMIGQSIIDLWPTQRPLPDEWMTPGTHQLALQHQDGQEINVSLTVVPMQLPANSDKLVTVLDFAEMERMNAALLHTQRLAGVGTMTASVAHELTTPLSIITTTCSNLLHAVQTENFDQAELSRYVELIEQSAFRSARIVEVLRNYSHLDGPEIAITDVESLVRDALTLVEQQFRKQANVTILVERPPHLRSVVCDHNRITQVLVNLLSNARDAMQPAGGEIKLRFWPLTDAAVENDNMSGKKIPDQFAFAVSDTGHGIPADWLEKIFQPFFTTKPNGQGTGLGLYISRGIVAQHNGRIWAENNLDGGATFTVVLPQRQ